MWLIAKGRCGECSGDMSKDICWAVQQDRCVTLAGPFQQKFCQATLSGDPNEVTSVFEAMRAIDSETTKDKLSILLAVIKGFRNEGLRDCQSYLHASAGKIDPAYQYFVCRLAFAENPQQVLDNAERELTFFELGKTEPKYCDKIMDSQLKEACTRGSKVSP
jgi:hypothetical protein